ncbi:hypothetical protein [Nocardia africana]|uniref:Uncharacterized protein n=1 Tax=Nocardia africana TaxID=134964 RepID=A0A378WX23_9NOCA|nr:hypothetical protein [Nocardia africana]MCC3313654.1 hypothetical protein [Nocardia africana]SUA44964.1 Uncharacterised protein [Nocardia africana]
MTQHPSPDLDELRDAIAAQLSEWRTVASGDTFGFTRAGGGHTATTISARSYLRPDSYLLAEIGRRRANNDGTFDQSGPVHMVTLALTVDRAAASGEDVDYQEATAWRNVLLPWMAPCYALEDPSEPGAHAARSWFFTFFLGTQDQPLPAPADFDWVAHRVRYRGLPVSLVDDDGRRVERVYENPRFPRFYHPYTEARGRYWDIEVNQPPATAGITQCFGVLAKALACYPRSQAVSAQHLSSPSNTPPGTCTVCESSDETTSSATASRRTTRRRTAQSTGESAHSRPMPSTHEVVERAEMQANVTTPWSSFGRAGAATSCGAASSGQIPRRATASTMSVGRSGRDEQM